MNQKNKLRGWVYLSLFFMILGGSCNTLYAKKKKKTSFFKQVHKQVTACVNAVSAESVYGGVAGLYLYMALVSTYMAYSETARPASPAPNRPCLTPRMLLAYWSLSGCYGILARQAYAKAVDEQNISDDDDDDDDDDAHHLKHEERT